MAEVDAVLKHLPKRTPIWATGLVTVIVAVTTSLISVYLVSKEDLKPVVTWAQKQSELKRADEAKNYSDTLTGVLNLVKSNSDQIVQLSATLGQTQQQNIELTNKVTDLERRVDMIQGSLKECEQKLRICEHR